MSKIVNTKTRREFIKTAAAGTVVVAAGNLSFPYIVKAAKSVKIGVVHPVTGWAQYSGSQCRFGALMALEEINSAGGIKSMEVLSWKQSWVMPNQKPRLELQK